MKAQILESLRPYGSPDFLYINFEALQFFLGRKIFLLSFLVGTKQKPLLYFYLHSTKHPHKIIFPFCIYNAMALFLHSNRNLINPYYFDSHNYIVCCVQHIKLCSASHIIYQESVQLCRQARFFNNRTFFRCCSNLARLVAYTINIWTKEVLIVYLDAYGILEDSYRVQCKERSFELQLNRL